jgi:hypothetical protein
MDKFTKEILHNRTDFLNIINEENQNQENGYTSIQPGSGFIGRNSTFIGHLSLNNRNDEHAKN